MAAGTYERKEITGGAPQATLTAGITGSATTITISDATGWPDGASYPFVVAIGLGTATEEKLLITSRAGTTLTVETRGYDDTVGVAHDSGVTIDHVLDASTVDQVNRLANLQETKGAFIVHNGTNPVELDPGLAGDGSDDDYVLVASDAAATGWALGRPLAVTNDASAPSVTGVERVWIDETSNLVRFSDGTSWVIPVTVPSVADDTARDTLVGGAPADGTIVYREDYDFLERHTESAWKPATIPTFADTATRDTYYSSPADGDKARISSTYAEYEYRQDEWILTNQKITVSASAPADPHDGDIWHQPV